MTPNNSPARLLLDALTAAGIRTACDDAEESAADAFGPLSLEIYRSGCGGYIADVDLTVGGPTISARYETRRERLTLTAAWGGDRLEVSCDRCPLIDWIEAAEECSRF